MSLATRCAACGTVFRVVQDQLKVSEGWVRCGRCNDVFNALEGLFDLERESAPNWTPSQRAGLGLGLLPVSADERAEPPVPGDSGLEAGVVSETAEDTEVDTRADSQVETRLLERDDLEESSDPDLNAAFPLENRPDSEPVVVADAAEPTPAFLRQADTAARWQRPRVRLALTLAALLLGLLLAAQSALLRRDEIAVRWPQAAPTLALLCEALSCRIEPLRRLDGLAVESSGLTELDNGSLYRLQVSLRNRDTLPLLTPALDLTLTDSRGDIVARKVLDQPDFGTAGSSMVAAGAALTLQVVLDTGERRVTGYSVEIFYP